MSLRSGSPDNLLEQFQQLLSCRLVHGHDELVDWWRYLQALLENRLLTLDVDELTNTEVLLVAFE